MAADATTPGPAPPAHIVFHAVMMAAYSPCQSQRGAVAFLPRDGGSCASLISAGWNRRQEPPCDGTATCKATCGRTALHAEQSALLEAGSAAEGCDMLHVKVSCFRLVASGGPSCLECSKLMFAAGIAGVWLFHLDGWRRYPIAEFHALTLSASRPVSRRARQQQDGDLLASLREAVRLYESYGLLAQDADCGKWVNGARAAIAKAESSDSPS